MCGTQTIHTTTTMLGKVEVGSFLFDCGIDKIDFGLGFYWIFVMEVVEGQVGWLVTCRCTVVGLQWG